MKPYSETERINDNNLEKIFWINEKFRLHSRPTFYDLANRLKPKLAELNKKQIYSFSYKDLGFNIYANKEGWQDEYSGVVLEYKKDWGFYVDFWLKTQKFILINN